MASFNRHNGHTLYIGHYRAYKPHYKVINVAHVALALCVVYVLYSSLNKQQQQRGSAKVVMKIKPEHYVILEKWLVKARQETYSFDAYFNALQNDPEEFSKVKNPKRRYVWDMFWFARQLSLKQNCEFVQCIDAVYEYADDSHIETVLKKILEVKF